MPLAPIQPPSAMLDEEFQGPMSPEEWKEISPAKKATMIQAYHQSIIHGATEMVRAAAIASITALMEKAGNPTQALVILAQWDDPVFKTMPEDARARFSTKIMVDGKPMPYLVIPYERDLWTGGVGAPDWAKDHPYRDQMLKLCEEPDPGKFWIAIFAGGAALALQSGDKPIDKPGMDTVNMPEVEVVRRTPEEMKEIFSRSQHVDVHHLETPESIIIAPDEPQTE